MTNYKSWSLGARVFSLTRCAEAALFRHKDTLPAVGLKAQRNAA